MRIVCIIGSDRSGKSVLSDMFKSYGWIYQHFNPPKGSPYKEYRGFLDDVLKDPANINKNFVVDRYMYCEFPYSKHFGRKTDMTITHMNEIEDEILKLDPKATVIYCENDLDINWDLLQAEGRHDFKTKEEVRKLRQDYRNLLRWSHLKTIEYDYTKGDEPEDIYNQII